MSIELLIQIATLIGVAVAAGSLIIGVIAYKRQINAQLFIEYTKRYEQIMSQFPDSAIYWRLDSAKHIPQESRELSEAMLKYLNLCSEEFYLQNKRYLSKNIWSIWEDELKKTLANDLYRREWPKLKSEFSSYPAFSDYVEAIQRS
ncbi:MAG: hypothetical protein K9N35_02685 [Candidatus Marinimicrobia bacterium]|nr:hypothetical protein [Candidatus Neomarinimicrobiota bacterium]